MGHSAREFKSIQCSQQNGRATLLRSLKRTLARRPPEAFARTSRPPADSDLRSLQARREPRPPMTLLALDSVNVKSYKALPIGAETLIPCYITSHSHSLEIPSSRPDFRQRLPHPPLRGSGPRLMHYSFGLRDCFRDHFRPERNGNPLPIDKPSHLFNFDLLDVVAEILRRRLQRG